jgi:hypothetical protein
MLYPTELRAREAISITFKHLQPAEHLAFWPFRSIRSNIHLLGRKFGSLKPRHAFQRLLCGAPRVAGELLFRVPERGHVTLLRGCCGSCRFRGLLRPIEGNSYLWADWRRRPTCVDFKFPITQIRSYVNVRWSPLVASEWPLQRSVVIGNSE